MSLVFVVSRGILAIASPAAICWPFTTMRWAPIGSWDLNTVVPLASLMEQRAQLLLRAWLHDDPLAESGDPVHLLLESYPSATSRKWTVPANSVRIEVVNGSHSTRSWPAATR